MVTKSQHRQAYLARRIHSGINPEESFNAFRGMLIVAAFTLIAAGCFMLLL